MFFPSQHIFPFPLETPGLLLKPHSPSFNLCSCWRGWHSPSTESEHRPGPGQPENLLPLSTEIGSRANSRLKSNFLTESHFGSLVTHYFYKLSSLKIGATCCWVFSPRSINTSWCFFPILSQLEISIRLLCMAGWEVRQKPPCEREAIRTD